MAYLLDTSMVSDLVCNPRGVVAGRIKTVGETKVATSIIVKADLRFGARKRGSKGLTTQLEAVLRVLAVLPLEPPADAVYGRVRARIEREGRPMGANDLLIASHAIPSGTLS